MNGILSQKAMLVKLGISQWTARKYDKDISAKVANDYQTTSDSGRYNKVLIAETAIAEISKAGTEARTFHYANTLPWLDDGSRILPSANYLPYTQAMQSYRLAFESAVRSFIDSYADFVSDARVRLNGMFRESDYPGQAELAGKYGFEVGINPMPCADDFRVDLGTSEVESIRAEITARAELASQTAMRDLWDRLHDAVSHMADKLSDDKAIFRDSLVGNLSELCELLPRLNVMADPDLESMRKEVTARLCASSPKELRDNPSARKTVAKDAKAVLESMAGYTG
jgi:hypothetical protein